MNIRKLQDLRGNSWVFAETLEFVRKLLLEFLRKPQSLQIFEEFSDKLWVYVETPELT